MTAAMSGHSVPATASPRTVREQSTAGQRPRLRTVHDRLATFTGSGKWR
jgi:hypothetical protein